MYIKTDILLDDSGKEFDLGRARRKSVWLKVLSKETALKLFDEKKRVYFIYKNNRIYNTDCRKVCTNRSYLEAHYDWYHESCGILAKTVELCTFPENDNDYCHSFTVPKDWLLNVLDSLDRANNREGVNLKRFLDNYIWDETYFIYENAKQNGVLLEEETVH